MVKSRNKVQTLFNPWDIENQPGRRVRDLWEVQILYLNHPTKSSEEYEGWLTQHKDRIAQSMSKYYHVIFTDASVTSEEDAAQAGTIEHDLLPGH